MVLNTVWCHCAHYQKETMINLYRLLLYATWLRFKVMSIIVFLFLPLVNKDLYIIHKDIQGHS